MAEGLSRFLGASARPCILKRKRTGNFGVSPNDAGPLWLGLRLISPRSEQAYQGVTYSKKALSVWPLRKHCCDP